MYVWLSEHMLTVFNHPKLGAREMIQNIFTTYVDFHQTLYYLQMTFALNQISIQNPEYTGETFLCHNFVVKAQLSIYNTRKG